MNVSYDFSGKNVFITGGAGGIGLGTAKAFAKAGAHVIVSDIDEDAGAKVVAEIEAGGGKAEFVRLDVSDRAAVASVINGIIARHGQLDIAFNNAGAGGAHAPLAETDQEDWCRVIEIDQLSVYFCMHSQINAMLKTGGGIIVNNASIMGLMGGYGLSAYMSAKYAVIGMTRAAAMDYARKGIRINVVCPGTIESALTAVLPKPMRERLDLATPQGRTGTVDEVAQAVMWLASDAASYLVGHALPVDGGQVLGGIGTRTDDLPAPAQ
jgi:NAD(P)-dependent dehydrogenase (short-subunit alcohol dehydrogenase family)